MMVNIYPQKSPQYPIMKELTTFERKDAFFQPYIFLETEELGLVTISTQTTLTIDNFMADYFLTSLCGLLNFEIRDASIDTKELWKLVYPQFANFLTKFLKNIP